jgi:hypothetical protein
LAHRRHEPIDVAAAADRGASIPAWLAGCFACLALRADLLALASAAPSAAIPRRIRDLRLSAADAARLRSRARWWTLDWIGTSRDRVSRPLALGLTTIGLVGVVLTAIPLAAPGLVGASWAAPASGSAASGPASVSAGASDPVPALAAAPSSGAVDAETATVKVEVRSAATPAGDASPWPSPTVLSALAGSGGLALFALRHAVRRRGSIR